MNESLNGFFFRKSEREREREKREKRKRKKLYKKNVFAINY